MRKLKIGDGRPLPLQSAKLSQHDQTTIINRLLVINQLSLALQTQVNEDRLLHIVLSGITAGEALGFNRALVFYLNDAGTEFFGKLGVGPINEEECRHIWQGIAERGLNLQHFIDEFECLHKYLKASLNRKTEALRLKFNPGGEDLFSRTVEENACFHVTPEHYLDLVPGPVAELLEVHELVTAPLAVSGKALGLIVADNKFSSRPITEEVIQLLSIVANQTASAVSHIRLIRELESFHTVLEEKVREAVAEKERAQGEMIRHAKLATVGEMAVTIAHEIRNPLTSVRGFAQRLLKKYDDPETVHTYSDIIIQEVDRLNRVLGDVLDFARNVDALFGPVDLNEVVEKTVALLREKLGRSNIICETELDPDLPICHYDGNQLTQVLINLLKNGAEAMKQGGVLEVNTAVSEETVTLTVSDTGHGIEKEMLEHIFEPFYTTKTRGTGLGLAFAKRVIEEHGGGITASSEIDQGTTFTITLPLKREVPKVEEVIESIDSAQPLVNREDPFLALQNRFNSVKEGGEDG